MSTITDAREIVQPGVSIASQLRRTLAKWRQALREIRETDNFAGIYN